MKKLLILVLCLFSFNVAFAQNLIITPVQKQDNFKKQAMKLIKKETTTRHKEVDEIYSQACAAYNMFLNITNPKAYKGHYLDKLDSYADLIDQPEFQMHVKLIDLTNKYINIKNEIPATGFSGALYDFITPYLKANGVSISKIDELAVYAGEKQEQIMKFYEQVRIYGERQGY